MAYGSYNKGNAKQYIGNGKTVEGKFGSSLLFKLSEKDVAVINQQLAVNKQRGVNRVDIYISKRKEVGQYGDTHMGVLSTDTKPYTSQAQAGGQPQSAVNTGNANGHRYSESDLPPTNPLKDIGF